MVRLAERVPRVSMDKQDHKVILDPPDLLDLLDTPDAQVLEGIRV
jgi:hypothetical protein